MVHTLEPYTVRHGQQTIEVDVAVPPRRPGGRRNDHWLVPAVFLEKQPVAPDLDVRDAAGAEISVPSGRQNQELTLAALGEMHRDGLFNLDAHPQMREIIADIVIRRRVFAEVGRLQLSERVPDPEALLDRLLTELESKFLLWVPVRGEVGDTHRLTISCGQPWSAPDVIFRKGREVEMRVEMAIGRETLVGSGPFGRYTFSGKEALERILRVLGLAPISVPELFQEAPRVDSYHLRLRSPRDFVIRGVRLARLVTGDGESGERRLVELGEEPGQTIQRHESEVAHVHCIRRKDDAPLMLEVLLGVRAGLTTLWTLGVMLTTIILWIFKSDIGPVTQPGRLEVAAAILLLGPAVAAAWVVRSDEGHLLRNVLSGTRQLLMGSALLSVAATLALIGYTPPFLGKTGAIEVYAAISYAIAVVVVISWSITRKAPWSLYRSLLYTPKRNLWWTAALAVLAAVLAVHGFVPDLALGFALLPIGLFLAWISANRVGVEMGRAKRPFAPVAGIASALAFLAAGAFLGFYEDVVDLDLVRWGVVATELAMAVWAVARAADQ